MVCLICRIKSTIKQPLSKGRVVLNFSKQFQSALHTVHDRFMGSTITFITGILLVRELHCIIVLLIPADTFDNIVDLLLDFVFICPLDIAEDSRKIKCDYKLQYTLNEINCVIEQTNGFLRCYGPKFKRREYFIEENAPHNIIGLYSGEEDRLWTSFYETYYKSYIKRIKTNRHQERMRLMLINKYYWNVALLTLLLSGNETLKPFIENDLGITSISTIELKFNDVKIKQTSCGF